MLYVLMHVLKYVLQSLLRGRKNKMVNVLNSHIFQMSLISSLVTKEAHLHSV